MCATGYCMWLFVIDRLGSEEGGSRDERRGRLEFPLQTLISTRGGGVGVLVILVEGCVCGEEVAS